ncbi:hypothetical protein HK098_003339 [Nowakowskiella sp. JEL0407]|nr:hypothetical protein HK098_003339 [Nowakowskiella sp. JEL0407]
MSNLSAIEILAKKFQSYGKGRILCLTGAGNIHPLKVTLQLQFFIFPANFAKNAQIGVSTDSGIPSYRGARGVQSRTPITFQAFQSSASFRDRYWARSYLGYPVIRRAQPNSTHRAITSLMDKGHIGTLITQNVDSLHGMASERLIEIHGSLRGVKCLECGFNIGRDEVQHWLVKNLIIDWQTLLKSFCCYRLTELNPIWAEYFKDRVKLDANTDSVLHTLGSQDPSYKHQHQHHHHDVSDPQLLRPDGDVDLDHLLASGILPPFQSPPCPICPHPPSLTSPNSSILKPTVLFFGESMHPKLTERTLNSVDDADMLLVVGSTLTVYSSYRIVLKAVKQGVNVVIVNKGETRADGLECIEKIDCWSGEVLPEVAKLPVPPRFPSTLLAPSITDISIHPSQLPTSNLKIELQQPTPINNTLNQRILQTPLSKSDESDRIMSSNSGRRGPPPKPPKPSSLQQSQATEQVSDYDYYKDHNPFSNISNIPDPTSTTQSTYTPPVKQQPVSSYIPPIQQSQPRIPERPQISEPPAETYTSSYTPYIAPTPAPLKNPFKTDSPYSSATNIAANSSSSSASSSARPSVVASSSTSKPYFPVAKPSAVHEKHSVRDSENMPTIDAQSLAAQYNHFTASEISAFHQQFVAFDKDSKGAVHSRDLTTVATKAGVAYQDVVTKLNALKLTHSDESVDFESFLKAVSAVKIEKGSKKSDKAKITLHGTSENTTHTINEDEKQSFVTHINQQLGGDKDIKNRLPFDPETMQIFAEVKDGLVLAKLINDSVPNTIDERVLNMGTKKLSPFQMHENNNVVVNSAKAIGCSVVNIGASDLIEGREHLVLGLIWQIIKIGLSAKVDIRFHPELFRLLEDGETLEQFLKLPTEQILLRWFNYHLKKAGWDRRVNNFSSDVKDAQNYTVLLNQLAPQLCSRSPLNEPDARKRAEQVLENADKLGCRKYLTSKTLVEGNPKLNFAFVANLFNNHPGLEPLSETEMGKLDESMFNSEGSREARAFALWLNSLGVDPFVNNLFDDLSDGLIILQAIDFIHPGTVDWKKVNRPATSRFKKVENTNYCIVLGKSMKFTLVAVQGSDITDGVKTLILGYVWQLMREHIVVTLRKLSSKGKDITDSDIISWANDVVARQGKSAKITSFKDSTLRSGHFLLDLLNGIKKGIVDYNDEAKLNAKYAISIARKLGATIFVLPEDIIEVKPKMNSASKSIDEPSPTSPTKLNSPQDRISPVATATVTPDLDAKLLQKREKEIQRKISHSAIERRRRERINDKIDQIRALIPACANRDGLHKLSVLQYAIDYIQQIQRVLEKNEGQQQPPSSSPVDFASGGTGPQLNASAFQTGYSNAFGGDMPQSFQCQGRSSTFVSGPPQQYNQAYQYGNPNMIQSFNTQPYQASGNQPLSNYTAFSTPISTPNETTILYQASKASFAQCFQYQQPMRPHPQHSSQQLPSPPIVTLNPNFNVVGNSNHHQSPRFNASSPSMNPFPQQSTMHQQPNMHGVPRSSIEDFNDRDAKRRRLSIADKNQILSPSSSLTELNSRNTWPSATSLTDSQMKLFEQSHKFDHPWNTITLANYRKYPNDLSSHVLSVDILRREVDPSTGLLVTERLLCCKQALPPLASKVLGTLLSSPADSPQKIDTNLDSSAITSQPQQPEVVTNTKFFGWWGNSPEAAQKPLTDIAYFREVSVLDPNTQKYIAQTNNLSLRNIINVQETCMFEPDPVDQSKTIFTQRAAVTVGKSDELNTLLAPSGKKQEEIIGSEQLKAVLLSAVANKTTLNSVISDIETKSYCTNCVSDTVSSSWRSLTGFVEECIVSRFRTNSANGRKGLEMVVEKVQMEARGLEERIGNGIAELGEDIRKGLGRKSTTST